MCIVAIQCGADELSWCQTWAVLPAVTRRTFDSFYSHTKKKNYEKFGCVCVNRKTVAHPYKLTTFYGVDVMPGLCASFCSSLICPFDNICIKINIKGNVFIFFCGALFITPATPPPPRVWVSSSPSSLCIAERFSGTPVTSPSESFQLRLLSRPISVQGGATVVMFDSCSLSH